MWRPSPMATFRFEDDIRAIATDPRLDGDRVVWTEHYAEKSGGVEVVNSHLDPWHGAREAVGSLDRRLREELIRRGRVADQDRWKLRIEVGPDGVIVTANVTTWPAIPGLTVEDQP